MTIVAFSGRIASGKSAISMSVAECLEAPRVSFGDAVRSEARRRGVAETRANLQDLGDELVADGWDAFCDLVMNQAPPNRGGLLVVDGVRHLGAIEALSRRSAPERTVTVFVEAARDRRLAWLAERGVSNEAASAADAHPNEAEVDAVLARADVVIENDGSISDAVDHAIAALTTLGLVNS